MGNITIPAQSGVFPDHMNAGTHRPSSAIFNWIAVLFRKLAEIFEIPDTRPRQNTDNDGPTRAQVLEEVLLQAAESDSVMSRIMGVIEWFWMKDIQMKLPAMLFGMLFGMTCCFVFGRTRSFRGVLRFWAQLLLFSVAVVLKTPGIIIDLFFTNRFVDSPFLHWIIMFWRGFLAGLLRTLYQMFTGRRWGWARVQQAPPSPPPTPPRPISPPPRPRPIIDYIDDEQGEEMFGRLQRAAYRRDAEAQYARQEWERRLDLAILTAGDYHRRRRGHEARIADRERMQRYGYEPADEDRTGREPRSLRGEVGYWWPCIRVALVGLALVGGALGVVYYCETLEAGEDCGWVTEAVCGGGGVGPYECLGYNDRPIRETTVDGQVPPRFRFMSDGSKVRIPY